MQNPASIRSHQLAEIKFTARWDRDENGVYADVDVTDYPDWMSLETIRAIEKDISADMYAAAGRRVR